MEAIFEILVFIAVQLIRISYIAFERISFIFT